MILFLNKESNNVWVDISKSMLPSDNIHHATISMKNVNHISNLPVFSLNRNISRKGNSSYDKLSTLETRKFVSTIN